LLLLAGVPLLWLAVGDSGMFTANAVNCAALALLALALGWLAQQQLVVTARRQAILDRRAPDLVAAALVRPEDRTSPVPTQQTSKILPGYAGYRQSTRGIRAAGGDCRCHGAADAPAEAARGGRTAADGGAGGAACAGD